MRRKCLKLQSINPIQDIKEQIIKVERKHDTLTIVIVASVLVVTICAIIFAISRKSSFDYDAFYDDDLYDDDDFEDLDETDFE